MDFIEFMRLSVAQAPPLYAQQVLEINPAGECRLMGRRIGNGEALYACASLSHDGRIFCAPLEAWF